jgi:anthranilate phosphoribosyltransferase
MSLCDKSELKGGLPDENARITREILSGVDKSPKRDAVLINAGASLYIAEKVSSLADGIKLAQSLIDSGAAQNTLNKFVEVSNR